MLFNSYEFIFIFLPITLAIFFLLGRISLQVSAAWLVCASLFFYGWWNPSFIWLLLGSIIMNYALGAAITWEHDRFNHARKKAILCFAITANLLLLGYFKYYNFFLATLDELLESNHSVNTIVLPLGISFFTFTQIAFLVDASRGHVRELNFIHYLLFVTYFPHLIAGPVLHHKEMMPQFGKPETYRINYQCISVGLTIFVIGLFKKTVIADDMIQHVRPVFEDAANGKVLSFKESWGAALAYTMQIYFDFSGYSDMAIGLSKMFGIKLPLNFNSPYKSANIIEFWRCWHMTLSRFLRDYLYIPLGGNRKGSVRRYSNLMATMLLGGLWHGAGWTFLVWGGLHGLYLAINHGWHEVRRRLGHDLSKSGLPARIAGCLITFIAVVFAWVFFRADSLASAVAIAKAMLGMNGLKFTGHFQLSKIAVALAIAWCLPNTQQIMGKHEPALNFPSKDSATGAVWLRWQPNWVWFLIMVALATHALFQPDEISEFLYFQF